MIGLKRVYEGLSADDGYRVLVDRLWPRALSREKAALEEWLKEIAPSMGLCKWFGHSNERWEEFRRRYIDELNEKPDIVAKLRSLEKENGRLTLLYASKDTQHNNAVVLLEYLRDAGTD